MPDVADYPFEKHGIDVSRETRDKLAAYERLLRKWQKTINLIGESTLEELAARHFLDSAQLIKFIPDKGAKLADMGSGAGFPGMVLAMLGMTDVHLIESDIRKATFLREVSRETKTPVTIHDDRIEDTQISGLRIVTARALAPLKDLLLMATKVSDQPQVLTCLFLKGEKTAEELVKAEKKWRFTLEESPSLTDAAGRILRITGLSPK